MGTYLTEPRSPVSQVSDGLAFQVMVVPSVVAVIVPCSSVRNTEIPAARSLIMVSAWGCPYLLPSAQLITAQVGSTAERNASLVEELLPW